MAKHGKKYLEAKAKVDNNTYYQPREALQLVKETTFTNFDASVEVHMRMGLDPRQAGRGRQVHPARQFHIGQSAMVLQLGEDAQIGVIQFHVLNNT